MKKILHIIILLLNINTFSSYACDYQQYIGTHCIVMNDIISSITFDNSKIKKKLYPKKKMIKDIHEGDSIYIINAVETITNNYEKAIVLSCVYRGITVDIVLPYIFENSVERGLAEYRAFMFSDKQCMGLYTVRNSWGTILPMITFPIGDVDIKKILFIIPDNMISRITNDHVSNVELTKGIIKAENEKEERKHNLVLQTYKEKGIDIREYKEKFENQMFYFINTPYETYNCFTFEHKGIEADSAYCDTMFYCKSKNSYTEGKYYLQFSKSWKDGKPKHDRFCIEASYLKNSFNENAYTDYIDYICKKKAIQQSCYTQYGTIEYIYQAKLSVYEGAKSQYGERIAKKNENGRS